MKSKLLLSLLTIFLFAHCNSSLQQKTSSKNTKTPNIIVFYADDLGWMDLSIQGSPYYETPNIDRLAKEGMRFTNAYANAANCAPSRACLMTGLYTPRHGIYTVGTPARGKAKHRKLIPIENKTVLDKQFLTMPSYLKQKGYQTCMAGKWHLSDDPTAYGFDANFGGFKAGHPKSYFSPYKNPNLKDGPEGEHLPDRLATEMVNWIKTKQNQPFFAYFPFYSVHTPIQARDDLTEKYQKKPSGKWHNKATYAAMIEAMDLAVGKILNALDKLQLADNTLIIFTSDNGAHGGQTLSRPLRGAKGMYYEGGIRVPFIVKYPGIAKANSTNDHPIIGSDIFPTLVDVLESKQASFPLDGRSFLPLLRGKNLTQRPLFWHFPAYLQGYHKDRAYGDAHEKAWWRTTPVSVIRDGDWKLLEFYEDKKIELYNLSTDIGERENLIETHPDKSAALHDKLKAWRKAINAPVPNQLNPEFGG